MNRPKSETDNELESFLASIGKIYQSGVNLRHSEMYPGSQLKVFRRERA